ncbi:unnamed protein product [Albugo candida]|uniref:Uncharacterized protein n=1 Tax=Albugo candida TaxID=65357 RepID=A0A024FWK1_9STRA|nr:unnamed protein product [Albugo candida]|eukprot:CCI11421.1 unnamed protein product [Albugo candida]
MTKKYESSDHQDQLLMHWTQISASVPSSKILFHSNSQVCFKQCGTGNHLPDAGGRFSFAGPQSPNERHRKRESVHAKFEELLQESWKHDQIAIFRADTALTTSSPAQLH